MIANTINRVIFIEITINEWSIIQKVTNQSKYFAKVLH